MSSETPKATETLTREAWLEVISRNGELDAGHRLKRGHQRCTVSFGIATLTFEVAGKGVDLTASLLQMSEGGLMVKTRMQIPTSTPLRIEANIEDKPVHLIGRVAHCTLTVGGYKLGIQLQFPEN